MTKSILAVLLPLAILCAPAFAAESFTCGGAEAEFTFEVFPPNADGGIAVLTVRNGARATILRHDSVDFVGGMCVSDMHGRDLILYQAYCGGSGCRDLDNYGVVDPLTLVIRLFPNDSNRNDVAAMLGGGPPAIPSMISVERSIRGSPGDPRIDSDFGP